MNKLTAEEIIKVLEESEVSAYEIAEESSNTSYHIFDDETRAKLGVIEKADFRIDEDYSHKVVHYFKDHDVYLEQKGSYNSYEAMPEWEFDFKEVRPKEVKKTVYE